MRTATPLYAHPKAECLEMEMEAIVAQSGTLTGGDRNDYEYQEW